MVPDNFVVLVAVLALVFLACVLLRLIRLSRQGQQVEARRLALICGGLWMIGLLTVTLGGRPQDAYGHVFFNWIPFATQNAAHKSEIVMNCLLFTPAGALLPWVVGRRKALPFALAGAFLLSALIEVVQTVTPLGTAGDLTDILLNASGCALAAVCVRPAAGRRAPKYGLRSGSAAR
jgi:glycopeptide antibiotics resistance protein